MANSSRQSFQFNLGFCNLFTIPTVCHRQFLYLSLILDADLN